jgi:Periplasmic binding protein
LAWRWHSASAASAQNVVKLGMIGEFSGPFAQYGQQILGGMKAYMKQHGDTVAGKKIEIVQKDTGGPAPDVAKRLAQELVTHDKRAKINTNQEDRDTESDGLLIRRWCARYGPTRGVRTRNIRTAIAILEAQPFDAPDALDRYRE